MAACMLSMEYHLTGPVITQVAACASSVIAFQDGLRMIQRGEVDVVIRVKSAYRSIKDFFIDGVRLEPISAVSPGRFSEHAPGQLTSRPRLLEALPPGEIVRP